ncbi:DUF2064 domain-containing protein [Lysobacter sp. F6437]|uniref:DUF2064 domain-containing protein n=1 Tax=Lysobacter sp. F6437 TaxID=3459296 RepID=UPI00403DA115
MTGALAIFVKTPGRSPLKTRLASECGERYAIAWHRRAAAAVASVAIAAQRRYGVRAFWAVAESDALDAWPDLPSIAQGDGGLGARMARVHAGLVASHGFGLLVGADAPQITAELLGEAIGWLTDDGLASDRPRLALGPASDGGFWLFGSNVAASLPAWTSVSYSTDSTAADLRRAMQDLGEWRTLATLTDVDTAADLPTLRRALQALPGPTPEQSALARWMCAPTTPDLPDDA